jgi:hypothetical protein
VVMERGAGAGGVTVTLALADLVGSATLIAFTVTDVFTVTVGAVNSPDDKIDPAVAVQATAVFDALLTVAVNCLVPADGTVAEVGEMVTETGGGAAAMAIESCFVPVCGVAEESLTCAVKVNVPETLGVPLIAPVELFSDNPPGRAPAVTLQLYGGVPPEAASAAL